MPYRILILTFLIIAGLFPSKTSAQIPDENWNKWSDETNHDTIRLEAIKQYIWEYYLFSDLDSAAELNSLQLELATTSKEEKYVASAHNNTGIIFYLSGTLDSAYFYFNKALKINERIGNKQGIASARTNIASVLYDMGMYEESLSYNFQSLKEAEESGDLKAQSQISSNIGIVYDQIQYYDLAIEYYEKAIGIARETGDKKELMSALINLGAANIAIDNYDEGYANYEESYALAEETGDELVKASALGNLGKCLALKGKTDSALVYHEQSLAIFQEIGVDHHIAEQLLATGLIYSDKGQTDKALNNSLMALDHAVAEDALGLMERATNQLYLIYRDMGNYKEALHMFEASTGFRDSILRMENMSAVIEQNYQYEYEKQALVDSIEFENKNRLINLENKEQKAQLAKEKTQRYALWIGLFLVGVLAFVFLWSYRQKRADNLVINQQKKEVEEQRDIAEAQRVEIDLQHKELNETHKEITDSINYAKHLQNAILPALDDIRANLKSSFVLFNPKDVVSGDFYWYEKLDTGEILIAAADCTGHGVPGSLVSVVCSGALNRSVKEFGLKRPAEILQKTRELVMETFARSGDGVRDGMDIALCSVGTDSVVFCGANNPLWIVRETHLITEEEKAARSTIIKDELGLIEIGANRQPVGKDDQMKPFEETEVKLFEGDSLYVFSDGFADQFGHETGKKFKKKPFKELLIRINKNTMPEQEELLLQAFNVWKGNLEQIDDVCIIGIRV